ncbi:hypothetical protein ACPV5R_18610 [Vibrio astriarenae]
MKNTFESEAKSGINGVKVSSELYHIGDAEAVSGRGITEDYTFYSATYLVTIEFGNFKEQFALQNGVEYTANNYELPCVETLGVCSDDDSIFVPFACGDEEFSDMIGCNKDYIESAAGFKLTDDFIDELEDELTGIIKSTQEHWEQKLCELHAQSTPSAA